MKIMHLHIKPDKNEYYKSLASLYRHHADLKIAYSSLRNHFSKKSDQYENAVCIIEKVTVLE